jgi:hypothetical protein
VTHNDHPGFCSWWSASRSSSPSWAGTTGRGSSTSPLLLRRTALQRGHVHQARLHGRGSGGRADVRG